MRFIIILLAKAGLVFSQDNWQLNKDENGIKVYTSGSSSSKFKSLKVEAILTGTMQKLQVILLDVGNNNKWVYNTRQSHLIKKYNDSDILYYAETSLPWPLSNRDMAIRMQFIHDSLYNNLKVLATGMPDAIPVNKGMVRIRKFNALWEVKNLGSNQVIIHYLLTMEPGGSIPAGVSNMFIARGPYETFNNLSKLLME